MNRIDPTTGNEMHKTVVEVLQGKQKIVSYPQTSQYGPEGTGLSACGLAALNCARIIFRLHEEQSCVDMMDGNVRNLHPMFSKEVMEDIISICSAWQSSEHLEVEDLLGIPIFKNAFDIVKVEYGRSGYDAFLSLLRQLESTAGGDKDTVAAAVVTRPPEILVCLKVPVCRGTNILVVFDSHPRPTHPMGSGFILNSSVEATARYMEEILGIDPEILSDSSMRWQAQLLSQFCAHIVVQKDRSAFASNVDSILMEASTSILRLRAELAESQRRVSYLIAENEDMQSRLADLESSTLSTDKGKGKESRFPFNSSEHLVFTNDRQLNEDRPTAIESLFEDATAAAQLQLLCDKEDQELSSQRSTLLALYESFECRICFEFFGRDHICQFDACKHSFCRDCLRNYVKSTLNERRYPIFCPSCVATNVHEAMAVDDEMFEFLGHTAAELAIFRELQLATYSVIVHCQKCEETMFVDRGEYQSSNFIVCPMPRCNYTWCKNCQQPIEVGGPDHSCDGSSELVHLMKERGWRHCPGCQTPIQKESGCNHMTCLSPGCNTHFCYVCGELIVQSLNRTEIRNAVSAHYRKCRLFEYGGDR